MPGFLAKLDRFTIGLIASVGAGILVPCSGVWDTVFSRLSDAAIVLLFFLYGAKLSRRSVWEGLMHWRLQGLVAASTFVIFPLLGMFSMPLWNSVLGPDLCMGMLYVCMLPSTVQSSIAFTSMAGGNVAAAICSASVSSLLGVFLTPLLVAALVLVLTQLINHTKVGMAMRAVAKDFETSQLMGIKINNVISFTFAVGSFLAAIGSMMYFSNYTAVTPTVGAMPGLKAFVAAVFGGIGSIPGAVIGGFIIGICESLIKGAGATTFSDAFTFALLIVVLAVKPTGLFSENLTEKV